MIGRQEHQAVAIREPEAAADNQLEADFLCYLVGADDSGQGAFIGNRQRGITQFLGAPDQLRRVGGAVLETEI